MEDDEKEYCPKCGTELIKGICLNCDYSDDSKPDEYPTIEFKDVSLSFLKTYLYLIMGIVFIPIIIVLIGIIFKPSSSSIPGTSSGDIFGKIIFLFDVIMIGIADYKCFENFIKEIKNYQKVKKYGTDTLVTVIGYKDDPNIIINNKHAKIIKLLLNTNDGPRIINYYCHEVEEPFDINDQINIVLYEDSYFVPKEQ